MLKTKVFFREAKKILTFLILFGKEAGEEK